MIVRGLPKNEPIWFKHDVGHNLVLEQQTKKNYVTMILMYISKNENFDGKRFWNIGEREGKIIRIPRKENEAKFNLFSFFFRKRDDWKRVMTPEISVPEKSEILKISHINHSTVLIQINNLNIITDPVYSNIVSPFRFFGPKRYTNPRINFPNLPKIDIILLSHNHYDHMDIPTLLKIQEKNKNSKIITTLGNKKYLEDRGMTNIIETDWNDVTEIADIKIVTVPAQHFSARGLTDRNKTLWAGYVIETTGITKQKIYFAGDTGYGPFMEKIKDLYPDGFDFALLPIGAYKPRYFMSLVHISPEEALKMMIELKIKEAVAVHFGTFALAMDKQYDPKEELEKLKNEHEYRGLNLYIQK